MKTKTWIKWSVFFMIPLFFTCLVLATIGAEYWFGTQHKGILAAFLSGNIASKLLGILMLVNVFGIAVIMSTFLEISKKADQIDALDEATKTFYAATRKYEAATQALVRMQPLAEAQDLDRRILAENIKEYIDGKLKK